MSAEAKPKHIIRCPTCKKSIVYDIANPNRPFCCSRCKTIDIGQWADENFRLPEKESPLTESSDQQTELFIPPKYDDDL